MSDLFCVCIKDDHPIAKALIDQQFDRIWRIDYLNGKATIKDLPQHLMPGDSN